VTRFVAALLIARGRAVTAQADPRTPGCEDLGDVQPAAALIAGFAKGRRQRAEGLATVTRAGDRAWEIHRQQRGGGR